MTILEIIGIGVGAFVATNIDDLFILMVFFAKLDFPTSHIVLGQYVGMGSLLGVSLFASLIALVIPHNLLDLVGTFPIIIGVKEMVDRRSATKDEGDVMVTKVANRLSKSRLRKYLPFLVVTTVTFSGGEEIGIYTSIFVIYNGLSEIIIIILTVMVLTGVWCVIAFYLVNHRLLATRFRRLADKVLPLVLIAIGIYILAEAFLVPFFDS